MGQDLILRSCSTGISCLCFICTSAKPLSNTVTTQFTRSWTHFLLTQLSYGINWQTVQNILRLNEWSSHPGQIAIYTAENWIWIHIMLCLLYKNLMTTDEVVWPVATSVLCWNAPLALDTISQSLHWHFDITPKFLLIPPNSSNFLLFPRHYSLWELSNTNES